LATHRDHLLQEHYGFRPDLKPCQLAANGRAFPDASRDPRARVATQLIVITNSARGGLREANRRLVALHPPRPGLGTVGAQARFKKNCTTRPEPPTVRP